MLSSNAMYPSSAEIMYSITVCERRFSVVMLQRLASANANCYIYTGLTFQFY